MGNEINKRVAHYRKLAGFNQSQVAEMLGLKLSTYSQRERKGNITGDFLKKLSIIFGVKAEVLLYGEENKEDASLTNTTPEEKINPNLTPFLLDKREKELVTIYRNVSAPKKIGIFQFAYDTFKSKNKQ